MLEPFFPTARGSGSVTLIIRLRAFFILIVEVTMSWIPILTFSLLILHFSATVESKESPLDPVHANRQGILELPELPFDPNVIQDAKCREDVSFWMSAVSDFATAIAANCSSNDTACVEQRQSAMATNMFAARQVDSFGRVPVNVLNLNLLWQGSWEECMTVSSSLKDDYRTQFCWTTVISPVASIGTGLPATEEMCPAFAATGALAKWSVCMPRTCSNEDITVFLQSLNASGQPLELAFCSTTCRPYETPKRDAAFWVVTMYMAVAVLVVIIASLVDYVTDCDREMCKTLRGRTLMKCLLTFSIYTNGAEILSVQKRPGQIECLHCIRVVSMTWVMAGHSSLNYMGADNPLEMAKLNKYFLNLAFSNAFFSVDSFLFLGGLLLTFLFMKEMTKSPNKIRSPVYWTLYYVHRIVRLSVPYWLYLGFAVVYTDYLAQGPMETPSYLMMSNCRNSWWKNILYISNLFKIDHVCLGHTWYLAIDMQIHVFAPILLIPLFFSAVAGSVAAYLLIVLSSCLNYWAYYKYDSPASFAGAVGAGGAFSLDALDKFQHYLYFAPWIRCTPYIIGSLTGYFLSRTRGKKLRLHPLCAIGLWITALALGIACVYSLYDYYNFVHLSKFEKATYYNFSRIGWGLALAWVVIACENNWAGPIKQLMEMDFWAPFSRLTYCAYLSHYVFVLALASILRSPIHWAGTPKLYVLNALPLFCVSYLFAFCWSCVFEIPSSKLERMAVAALVGGPSRGAVRPAGHDGDRKAAIEPDNRPTTNQPAGPSAGYGGLLVVEPEDNSKAESEECFSGGLRSRRNPGNEKPTTASERPDTQAAWS